MYLTATELTITEQLTPYLPLLGTIVGAIVVGAFAIWNRKRGATETKAPDVNAIWLREERQNAELDRERRMRRRFEDFAGHVWAVFVGYVRRVQAGGSTDLTPREQSVIDNGTDIGDTEHTN